MTVTVDCLALCGLSASNQVSVLNHRLPKYGICFMDNVLEHVVSCYRVHMTEHMIAACDCGVDGHHIGN